jgi:hypothetical protein
MRFRFFLLVALLLPSVALAQSEQTFSDVSPSREEFEAVEDLRERGIFQGRPDGTFGPDDFVNRAEAITVVVRAVANVQNLPKLNSCFPDVHGDVWFVKPVCYAEDLGWISGYPDGTFQPVRTVAKAEFLKILLNAYGTNTDEAFSLGDPLAVDAANMDDWYFPFLSYAIASSMTSADSFGNLNPGVALTRGQVALLIHRFLLYREGDRNQNLLTNAEKDTRLAFSHLDALETNKALYAVGRVRLAAWGAGERLVGSPLIQATAQLGDALRSLVWAYRMVQANDLTAAQVKTQEAYQRAEKADTFSDSVQSYTDRVRSYAHDLAEDIRAHEEN